MQVATGLRVSYNTVGARKEGLARLPRFRGTKIIKMFSGFVLQIYIRGLRIKMYRGLGIPRLHRQNSAVLSALIFSS